MPRKEEQQVKVAGMPKDADLVKQTIDVFAVQAGSFRVVRQETNLIAVVAERQRISTAAMKATGAAAERLGARSATHEVRRRRA